MADNNNNQPDPSLVNPGSTPNPQPSGSTSGIGALASGIGKFFGAAPSIVQNAASGVANSGNYGSENTATVPLAPSATGNAEVDAANAIPGAVTTANKGLQSAANTEKNLAVPVGQATANSGLNTQKAAIEQQQNAIDEYRNAVENTHKKAIDTEDALNSAIQNAKIDPQNYLSNLGVSQKTLTAIGLALSGIGSGLTGQPNLAMQSVQANINRDIQAQQQIFQNKMERVATERGLLQSAQDRQNLSVMALNQATAMVSQGANVAITGLQTQVAGATAPDLVQEMILQNQLKSAESLSNINTKYVQLIKSGNTKHVNQLGLGLDTAAQQLTGSELGINKNPYGSATSVAPRNPQIQSPTPPTPTQDPLTKTLQEESNKRNSKPKPNEDFLDALSNAGKK